MPGPAALLASHVPILAGVDRDILHFVTCDLYAPWLDPILMRSQSKSVAVPVLLVTFAVLAVKWPRRTSALWAIVDRPRPQRAYTVILRTSAELATCASQPDALALRSPGSKRPSFPSRHGLTIGVFVTALWLAWPPAGMLAAVWGLFAAVGRVYAGKHWPSDVLAGILLGIAITLLVWRFLPRLPGPFRHLRAPCPNGDGASG